MGAKKKGTSQYSGRAWAQLQPLATVREDQEEGRKRQSAGGRDRKSWLPALPLLSQALQ